MLCEYLRHIDLHAVFERLPNYEPGLLKPSLANIPPQLCDTLARYLEELAEIARESFEGTPDWRHWEPVDIAAEVGDLIESELERIAWGTTWPAPLAAVELTHGGALESFLCFATEANSNEGEANSNEEKDDLALVCLLVYQYDALCSLFSSGHMDDALAVLESIAETRETLAHCQALGARDYLRSREARERAVKRHKETNTLRASILKEWEANHGEYEGFSDFARIIIKRDGLKVKERTVTKWLSDFHREKA
jgi:hypothetical protein